MRTRSIFAALAAAGVGACLAAGVGACQTGTAQSRDSSGSANTSAKLPAKLSSKAPPAEARVDLNHASVDELMKIPGMTRSWAGRIVRFRPYRAKNDLVDRGVVTSEVYDRIKDSVVAHREKE